MIEDRGKARIKNQGTERPLAAITHCQWGRIIACLPRLDSVDLIEPSLSLGRSEDCDVLIHKSNFLEDEKKLLSISKIHFLISKDPEDIYITYITDLSKNGTYVNGRLIGKGKTVVLQHKDVIGVGMVLRGLIEVYVFQSMKFSVDMDYLPMELRQKYEPSRPLGKGACGEVILLYEKLTCKKYALKKIIKARNTPSQMHNLNHPSRIQTEIEILQRLSHPLVMTMKEIMETDDDVFIVLEYVKGGELSARISPSAPPLSETNVKFIFYQIALAVQYLHSQGVTHRDLKPGNVLLSSTDPYSMIKVTDFGLSKISEGYDMKTLCGTVYFMAPEILNHTVYDKQADIWSLGVILFYMLSRELPFQALDKHLLRKLILRGHYNMNNPRWYEISPAAKDLIKRILVADPKRRITVEGILNHDWIAKDNLMRYRVEKLMVTSDTGQRRGKRSGDEENCISNDMKKIRLSNDPAE